jgi:hypothetical protein
MVPPNGNGLGIVHSVEHIRLPRYDSQSGNDEAEDESYIRDETQHVRLSISDNLDRTSFDIRQCLLAAFKLVCCVLCSNV